VEVLTQQEEAALPLEKTLQYAAFAQFLQVAKKLAGTSLAQLKMNGLETCVSDGNPA
jgi:hypothetical protein